MEQGRRSGLPEAINPHTSWRFVRKKSPERGIYAYALAFANSGYIGDPLVQMIWGDSMLSYYKLYCLPITIGIYTWGISNLVPHGKQAHPPAGGAGMR